MNCNLCKKDILERFAHVWTWFQIFIDSGTTSGFRTLTSSFFGQGGTRKKIERSSGAIVQYVGQALRTLCVHMSLIILWGTCLES